MVLLGVCVLLWACVVVFRPFRVSEARLDGLGSECWIVWAPFAAKAVLMRVSERVREPDAPIYPSARGWFAGRRIPFNVHRIDGLPPVRLLASGEYWRNRDRWVAVVDRMLWQRESFAHDDYGFRDVNSRLAVVDESEGYRPRVKQLSRSFKVQRYEADRPSFNDLGQRQLFPIQLRLQEGEHGQHKGQDGRPGGWTQAKERLAKHKLSILVVWILVWGGALSASISDLKHRRAWLSTAQCALYGGVLSALLL